MKTVLKAFVWKLICLSLLLLPAMSFAASSASNLIPVYALLLDGPTYHKVNVLTEGLAGDGFTVILNGIEELPIPADGSTRFPTPLENFSNFEITIKDPVTGIDQACRINDGTGIIISSDAQVSIDCTTIGYRIGGSVTGLDGAGLGLSLEDLSNGGFQRRQIKANGDFVLAALKHNTEYEVTILSQPRNKSQTCVLSNPAGTASATSINALGVHCTTKEFKVSPSVYGLASGESLELTNNQGRPGATSISVSGSDTIQPIMSKTPFFVRDHNKYALSVTKAPVGKLCQVGNPAGTVNGENVTDIAVRCGSSRTTASIGGNVSGLLGSRTTQLGLTLNDGIEEMFLINNAYPANVEFTFSTPLPTLTEAFGTPVSNIYSVTVTTQPNSMKCTVDANGTGAVGTGVANIAISCLPYIDPAALVIADDFVPNEGSLDGSSSIPGSSSSLVYNWGASSAHDFSMVGNGTTSPSGVTIATDKFEDPLYLDEVVCANNPLCLDDILSNGAVIDATVASTNLTLHVTGDVGHESTDNGNTFVYDDSLAYVKYGASGSGASPDDPAGDIKVGINYAGNNSKRGVAISQGTYTIDVDNGPINMVEGISLFGGYSASTWAYDPETYTTYIRGSGTGVPDETSDFTPVATVVVGPEITSKTWIKGLYIYSPSLLRELSTTALLIEGGDVTVKDNILRGFNTGEAWSGLTITDGSSARILNNTIYADGSLLVGELKEATGGAGIIIYWSQPTIESNRIRGGGAVGQGIVVFNSHPSIFNNIILGCEDGTNEQVCYGVKYLAEKISHTDNVSSGGKLYNNTILGGVPSPSNEQPDGTDGYAVFAVGPTSSPNIVNNILFSQNGAHYSDPEYNRIPCIASVNDIPAGIPASMYNNACIDGSKIVNGGANTYFHVYVYQASSTLATIIEDFIRDTHNAFLGWLIPWGNDYDDTIHYLTFSAIPFPELNRDERIYWGERNAAESNAEDVWTALSEVTNDLIWEAAGWDDFYVWVSAFSTFTPSGGNIDIDRMDFFEDFNGLDNDISTVGDNDWSIRSSAPSEIIQGGKCIAPDVHLDMDRGAARTPGWTAASGCAAETGFSMGAYEYDYPLMR